MDVLYPMFVTRAVSHFEMSALNASAPKNAVGVHVNAVAVEPEHKKKKNTQNCQRTTKSSWDKAIEQEDKEVEVGRTVFHGRHSGRVPL